MINEILKLITKEFGEQAKINIADMYGYTPEMELSIDDFIEEEVFKEIYQNFTQHAVNNQLQAEMQAIQVGVETKVEAGKIELIEKLKATKAK